MVAGASVLRAREHWQNVLLRGDVAAVPRWPGRPPGEGTPAGAVSQGFRLTECLVPAACSAASSLDLPVSAVLLGVHAKVAGLLSGERLVRVGYQAREQTLPCLIDLGQGSWRGLLKQAAEAEALTSRHSGYPVAELAAELGVPLPLFETAVALQAWSGDPLDGEVLRVGLSGPRLTMLSRPDAVSDRFAARIASYHAAAFELALTDPGGDHRRSCLLGGEELAFQDGWLAGQARPLPDRRFHELFEDQVRQNPEFVAAELAGQRVSYAELNRRANRLARALLARAPAPESVVAVCTDRDLDWLTAVLAIFKAGCVYLPVEAGLPAGRITAMLSRAGCRLMLTDRSRAAGLAAVLAAEVVPLGDPGFREYSDSDPRLPVAAGQAAYIFFTSGSTGEPKGAVCEHAGLLNHLLAKIDDLEIGQRTRVAQTAPLGFDISLWQLLAALLTGGTTVLMAADVVLDVGNFASELDRQRVELLQVVPSYLEILLAEFASGGRIPGTLRAVSVTGEALKLELAARWFMQCPEIPLINAYGATESSDDVTHEVMHRAPPGQAVPLGRPVPGAGVHVLDENLLPVPLGAPGEIAFSGVCVGRGYVNDEPRTRAAFVADPRRPGSRLYLSGDLGRWMPDGKLEYLGRRDRQVKIRGLRIEIGEIEHQLLRVPGISAAAVIVTGDSAETSSLVACYAAPPSLPVATVPAALARILPEYMIPAQFYWLDTLPLTTNGKVDTRALIALTGRSRQVSQAAPGQWTATERELAEAWAQVLGIESAEVARGHHFFDAGGTSLSALRLVQKLGRRPGPIALADLIRYPVLSELARSIDERGAEPPGGLLQRLGDQGEGGAAAGQPPAVLVCFPYAGGSAASYLPLARALRSTAAVYWAVPAAGASLVAQAEAIASEIRGLAAETVLLWGHSAGSAAALATARALQAGQPRALQAGKPRALLTTGQAVARVFVGAQLLGSPGDRRRSARATAGLSQAEVIAELVKETGYAELGRLDDQQASELASAYRRDSLAADQYFLDLLENPAVPLDVPVRVVVAADDQSTSGYLARYAEWAALSRPAELDVLPCGGHYFITSRPEHVAAIIARSLPDGKG